MRTLTPLVLLLTACPSVEEDLPVGALAGPAPLITEVGVSVEQEATVTNIHPELDLVVSDIRFEPDTLPVRWFSDAGWVIPPGESRTFRVWFLPEELGSWEARVEVVTNGDTLTAPLTLQAIEGADVDEDGMTVSEGDCDDEDATVYLDAPELCDGKDNDCDESVDEDFDRDNDGYLSADLCPDIGEDCNDFNRDANPGMEETCDGSDSDCNGIIDDIDDLADKQDGVCAGMTKRCTAGGPVEPLYEAIEGYESFEATCDGLDNDCDGSTDDFDNLADGTSDCVDDDGDGETEADGDCDDTDDAITSADCGPTRLVVTRDDDGFATIDLNTGALTLHSLGWPTFHGVATDNRVLWFAARNERRLIRYDTALATSRVVGPFDASPWAVEVGASGEVLALLGDGLLQRRDVDNGNLLGEVDLGHSPTAWTRDADDSLWVCTADGWVMHATRTSLLDAIDLDTACYSPPALRGSRLVVPGLLDSILVELDTSTVEVVRARVSRRAPVRATFVKNDVWATASGDDTVDVFSGIDLLASASISLEGQPQGIWYDEVRDRVWVAAYEGDEVIVFDRRSRAELARFAVPSPIYLFPFGGTP